MRSLGYYESSVVRSSIELLGGEGRLLSHIDACFCRELVDDPQLRVILVLVDHLVFRHDLNLDLDLVT